MIADTRGLQALRLRALWLLAAQRAGQPDTIGAQLAAARIEGFTDDELADELDLLAAEYPTHRYDLLAVRARVYGRTLAGTVHHA